MTILVTGAAGFIGFHLTKKLLENGHKVIGVDSINNYYSQKLKFDRLDELGIVENDIKLKDQLCKSHRYEKFEFYRTDLTHQKAVSNIFENHSFDKVCHLAAQAGVRYSLENPISCINNNIFVFGLLLEEIRKHNIKELIYASSSSVYGESSEPSFKTSQMVDQPISVYAATKKSNELMAHVYSKIYGISTIGLRFFTVYGPWGRPDMAYYLFTKAIAENEPIKVFNQGKMKRDFTFVDDIIQGIILILNGKSDSRYKIYNIGNKKTEKLTDFIHIIEKHLNKKAKKIMLPLQRGDVTTTTADIEELVNDFGYNPQTEIDQGLEKFVDWYKKYHK